MKRLDEMDFNEISIEYEEIFDFCDKQALIKIKDCINLIYEKYIKNIKNGFKIKGGTLGRGELKWGRNIIWGWYIEKIILEILKNNKYVSNIEFYGGDLSHEFIYDNTTKKILIEGIKETKPDFLIKLKSGIEICIELKTAAKGIFTIKKGNVEQLYKEAGYNNRITLILMIDLENKLNILENLKYFYLLKPFVNQRMEGQLCYNFSIPNIQLLNLENADFNDYIDNTLFDLLDVKKLKALHIAESINNQELIKLIKNKIKLDSIIEDKNFNIEVFNEKINNIKIKCKNIDTSWEEIFTILHI